MPYWRVYGKKRSTNRDGDALEEADAPETIYYTVGDDNMKEWTTTEDTAEDSTQMRVDRVRKEAVTAKTAEENIDLLDAGTEEGVSADPGTVMTYNLMLYREGLLAIANEEDTDAAVSARYKAIVAKVDGMDTER